jgi:hypothetical protein
MPDSDNVQALAAVIRESGATPRVTPERVVRSTLYDLDYHVALIACAFSINGEKRTDGTRSVVAHWLKLLQFIAVRPALLPAVQRWAKGRLHPDLDAWQAMPRGYLGDRTHDRTVELLVAEGLLYRMPSELQSGGRFDVLEQLYSDVETRGLLRSERDVLRSMAQIPVNRTMLRGA